MPDEHGVMSQDELDKAVEWVTKQWGADDYCPMHKGRTEWGVGPQMVQTVGYGPRALFGGSTFPLIPVTCQICGYMVFVNAILAGLIHADPALRTETSEHAQSD
jgi:hypothetical protein